MRIVPYPRSASTAAAHRQLQSSALRRPEREDAFEGDAKLARAMTRELDHAQKRNSGRGGVSLRITQGGRPLFEGAAGYTDSTRKRPMTVETPFDIASITKSFTAAMTLKLVE